ncbi:hypothetical protein [Dyadobacter bucti]|uniref:hypothetical protein n=1 Tax=Dyadobacter bucti TaxID=2572203 RepID=UPI003F6EA6CB
MKRNLGIAIFAPESSVGESFASDCKLIKFQDPDVETSIVFVDGKESLEAREFSYALFTRDWYKYYPVDDIRNLLSLFSYRYWHGYLGDSFDLRVSEIRQFLRTENIDDESDKKFYDSLANFRGFYHHTGSGIAHIC